MRNNEIETNEMALEYMKKQNFDKALELLEKNAINYPNYKTLNNLGVFLIELGDATKKYKLNSIKKGKEFLIKANEEYSNEFSNMELGNLAFSEKKYCKACEFYNEALKRKITVATVNNLAVSEYYNGRKEKAIEHLRWAYENSKGKIYDLCESYIYALSQNNKKKLAGKILQTLLKNEDYDLGVNTLYLAFYCENYKYIVDNYLKVLSYNMLELELCKILKYCIVKSKNRQELWQYEKHCVKYIFTENIFNTFEKVQILKIVFLKKIKWGDIKETFYMQLLYECHYFGCKEHNNTW